MDLIYRYDSHQPSDDSGSQTAEDVERWLVEGHRRFGEVVDRVRAEMRDGHAGQPVVIPSHPLSLGFSMVPGQAPAQKPLALVLGCSDARAPVEMIFDCSSNELFIVRVAGNVLGAECLGSLEYAIRHLASRLRLVVVLGHGGCGAVAAAVDLYLNPANYGAIAATQSLRAILDRILFVVRIADKALERRFGPAASSQPGYRASLWEMAVYLNAALTAYNLARELGLTPEDDPVRVVYGVYDLETQRVARTPRDDQPFAPAPTSPEVLNDLSDRLAEAVLTSGLLRPVVL